MRADAAANRETIVNTAEALFLARGEEVTMSSLARAAGVGPATLYRHFPQLEDVAIGVMSNVSGKLVSACEAWLPGVADGKDIAWRGFIDELVGACFGPLLVIVTPLVSDEAFVEHLEPKRAASHAAVDAVLDAAKQHGLVRRDVVVGNFLMGLGMLTRPMPERARRMFPDAAPWALDTYLRGLRPDATK